MTDKEKEFFLKLADLMEEYKVEIENDYYQGDCGRCDKVLDFDFQVEPYTTVSVKDIYIDCDTFRGLVKEL